MYRKRTSRTLRPKRLRLFAIGIAAVLTTALLTDPAFAQDATPAPPAPDQVPTSPATEAPTAPAPEPPSPESPQQTPDGDEPTPDSAEASSLPQATQMIQGSAVPAAATGFKLQYGFGDGVQPADRKVDSNVTSEANYDWSDGGVHYLQWDYPMPEDGQHSVTFTAKLIDYGASTDYTVRFTSTVARISGSITVRTDCEILKGDVAVDFGNESPFTCNGISAQTTSGAVLGGGSVSLMNWSTIAGVIDVRNAGTGPLISLGEGTFSTANQQRRIIMNGAAWYPLDATVKEQRALPYATIPNGGQLTWMAAQQEFGVSQTEPDTHAQATFTYRIHLDNEPTPYWISGWAENYKYLQGSEPSARCSIYLGDPNTVGQEVVTQTPFTCETTPMTKPNVHTYDDTTFQVRMASVDTLTNQADAKSRGIAQACAEKGSGACAQILGEPSLHVAEAADARVIDSNPHTEGGPGPKIWRFDKTWSRQVKDSVQQSFGFKVALQYGIPGNGTTYEFNETTTYGYDLTKGLSYTLADSSSIPFGATGSYVQYDAWDVYRGDLYFFGEGDSWYRVTGTTVTIPIDSTTYGEQSLFDGHKEAGRGARIGNVEFRCVWDDAHKKNVLLHHHTLKALTLCQIPDTWSDEIPNVPGVDIDPNLIRDARSVLADEYADINASLQQDAAELQKKRK